MAPLCKPHQGGIEGGPLHDSSGNFVLQPERLRVPDARVGVPSQRLDQLIGLPSFLGVIWLTSSFKACALAGSKAAPS